MTDGVPWRFEDFQFKSRALKHVPFTHQLIGGGADQIDPVRARKVFKRVC